MVKHRRSVKVAADSTAVHQFQLNDIEMANKYSTCLFYLVNISW